MRIIGDGELKASLSSLIDKFGLTNKIKMVGALPPSLIAQEMAKSDIFLVPSLFEGLPTVIKEAMAVGLPVIASNIGGIPEIITDGYNGFLVESKNAAALANKIEYVLNNLGNLNIIKINARKTIEGRFNTIKQMKLIEDLYGSLIKENTND
jgi:glycosyltransferase involved in cell wall biosynthesis